VSGSKTYKHPGLNKKRNPDILLTTQFVCRDFFEINIRMWKWNALWQ